MWTLHAHLTHITGAVTLNLNRIPRPAKYPKDCSERLLATDGSVPTLNLFKNLRCRGWWPMVAKEEDSNELTVSLTRPLLFFDRLIFFSSI